MKFNSTKYLKIFFQMSIYSKKSIVWSKWLLLPPPVSSISRNSSSKTGSGEFAKTMPINNCESVFTADALFGTTDHHQTSPTNQTFDFLTANHHHGTCRLKRSWSPSRWPDDDMDHLGAKKRRFFWKQKIRHNYSSYENSLFFGFFPKNIYNKKDN